MRVSLPLILLLCVACQREVPSITFTPSEPVEGRPFSVSLSSETRRLWEIHIGPVTASVPSGGQATFAAPPAGEHIVTIYADSKKRGEATLRTLAAPGHWLIAYGNRVNLDATRTLEDWNGELARIVDTALDGIPDPATAPVLLLLAESLGLPALLAGPDLDSARSAETALEAFAEFATLRPAALSRVDDLFSEARLSLPRRLMLATADTAYRTFTQALSNLARLHGIWIGASNDMPRVRPSRDPADVEAFAALIPDTDTVFVAASPEVFNTAMLFGPDGRVYLETNKVNLTPTEIDLLDLAAGPLTTVETVDTAFGRTCFAISLDAFIDSYVDRLDALGCRLMLQPDANSQVWAGYTCPGTSDCGAPGPDNGYWQPDEWLYSVLGAVSRSRSIEVNMTSMMTGLLYDSVFDGQSSISRDSTTTSAIGFVGQYRTTGGDGPLERCGVGTMSLEQCEAAFVSIGDWAFPDTMSTPIDPDPDMLQNHREQLRLLGESLLRGGSRENAFAENRAIWWEAR